jgi:hypothetical protein
LLKQQLTISQTDLVSLQIWARKSSPHTRDLTRKTKAKAFIAGYDDGFIDGLAAASQAFLHLVNRRASS